MLMFGLGYKPTTIDWEQQKRYSAWRLQKRMIGEIQNRQRKAVRKFEILNPIWSAEDVPLVTNPAY